MICNLKNKNFNLLWAFHFQKLIMNTNTNAFHFQNGGLGGEGSSRGHWACQGRTGSGEGRSGCEGAASEELVLPVPGKQLVETAVEEDEEMETDEEEEEVARAPTSTPEAATSTSTSVRPWASSTKCLREKKWKKLNWKFSGQARKGPASRKKARQ